MVARPGGMTAWSAAFLERIVAQHRLERAVLDRRRGDEARQHADAEPGAAAARSISPLSARIRARPRTRLPALADAEAPLLVARRAGMSWPARSRGPAPAGRASSR